MLYLLALHLYFGVLSAAAERPVARTSAGEVYGRLLPASSGGVGVEQFLGVPFAYAERFEPPEDFKGRYPYGGITADMWGSACMQVGNDPSSTYGSEDCLKANIWRPYDTSPKAGLPVMVFIYGGSNQFGEAEPYNMSALAAFHDVLCVSFNYRTGPIGWMAFEEDVAAGRATGNWGILDIQSALRWVQREAWSLGGDPTRVAIHGQSSGGGLVELQYVAPGSEGLFQGAISESGSLSAEALSVALLSARALAGSIGCLTPQKTVNKTCMAVAPALSITAGTYSGSWGPTVDGVTFPRPPQELLEKGLVNDASIVLGAQTNDSNLFLFRTFTKDGLDQPNNHTDGALQPLSPKNFVMRVAAMVGPALSGQALGLYPVDQSNHQMNVHQLGNMQSDQAHCRARQRASLFNKKHPGKAFTYRFDYWYTSNAACTAVPNYHLPYLGAAHQDEVTFVLGQPNFMEAGSCCGVWGLTTADCPHLERCEACYAPKLFGHTGYRAYFDEKEWAFARTVGRFWTNVAASGDPDVRASEAPSEGQRAWPKFGSGEAVVRNIVLNASVPGGHFTEITPYDRPELCAFWDRVDAHAESSLVV